MSAGRRLAPLWRPAPGGLTVSARELRDRLVLAPSLAFLAVWVIMFVNGYYGAA
jgi:hypothetical protein